jgi:hypothetical protein
MFNIVQTNFITTLWLALLFTWLIVNTFWLLTMQRALELVFPNCKMKPANVWLTYIPAFGLYWQFAVVQAVADSLGQEYIRRGIIPKEGRPGLSVGYTANILLCCALLPTFGILVALVSNISRLMHLFRIKNYMKELEEIMQVQMQYAQMPQPVMNFQPEINPASEEELKNNNPERFMPPETPEEARKRWGTK